MKNTVCTALMLLMSVCMYAQELYGEYEKKVYVSSQGDSLKYICCVPKQKRQGRNIRWCFSAWCGRTRR